MKKFNKSELSKLFNINKETIRYYTDIKLLSPTKNPSNGYYEYSIEDIFILSTILRSRYLNVPISKIKEIKSKKNLNIYKELIDEHLVKIDAEIIKLKELREILNNNKLSLLNLNSFKNNFDFSTLNLIKVEKTFFKIKLEIFLTFSIKFKNFFDISEKEGIFFLINLEDKNIFENIDFIYLEINNSNKALIEYLKVHTNHYKIENFKSLMIKSSFLGNYNEIKNYINEILLYYEIDNKKPLIAMNKVLSIPNNLTNTHLVNIFIKI